jgi:hypothetical protein
MQSVQRPHKRTAAALLVLATGLAGVTVTTSSALARRSATPPAHSSQATSAVPCTAQSCALNPTRGMSISIVPIVVPAGKSPSFTAPASQPTSGMLHRGSESGVLTCGGYHPADFTAVQFWLGGTKRADITYRVTDTVTNANAGKLQFCLGVTFPFTTLSGKPAKAVMLPNGLSGFAGLVPPCPAVPNPKQPCLVSKTQAPAPNSKNAVLKLLIPAIGDPWGRA